MTLQTSQTSERLQQGDIIYVSLWVPDVAYATRFFSGVLGWTVTPDAGPYRQIEGQSVAQGLSELGEVTKFLTEQGVPSPHVAASTANVGFVVDSIATSLERVRAAGGWTGTPRQEPYGLVVRCADDQGLSFSVHEWPADLPGSRPRDVRQGDVAYLTFEVRDAARARAFFGTALGLRFTPGRVADGWNIADIVPMSGLSGGHAEQRIVPMYRVDDIAAAVERVRALGGTATEPETQPYGRTATCDDGQGTRFYLGQF